MSEDYKNGYRTALTDIAKTFADLEQQAAEQSRELVQALRLTAMQGQDETQPAADLMHSLNMQNAWSAALTEIYTALQSATTSTHGNTSRDFAKSAAYSLLVQGVKDGLFDLSGSEDHQSIYDCVTDELGAPELDIPNTSEQG